MPRFKKIYIEITNVCNLSCSFCPKTKRPARFMDMNLFERILFEIKGFTRFIYFHVLGEPLVHPELPHMLDLSDRYGYKVNITTNGTLISDCSSMLLKKPALRQVNFSLHSFEANSGADCSMSNYLDDIFEFIHNARKDTNILIALRLWNLSEESTKESNRGVLQRIENELGLDYKIEEKLSPCKGIKLSDNIFLHQALKFEWPDINSQDLGTTGFCLGLRDQCAILADGTVVPCCLDGEGVINLGNIHEKPFKAIINSPEANGLFEGFSNRKAIHELCRKCSYRQRFDI